MDDNLKELLDLLGYETVETSRKTNIITTDKSGDIRVVGSILVPKNTHYKCKVVIDSDDIYYNNYINPSGFFIKTDNVFSDVGWRKTSLHRNSLTVLSSKSNTDYGYIEYSFNVDDEGKIKLSVNYQILFQNGTVNEVFLNYSDGKNYLLNVSSYKIDDVSLTSVCDKKKEKFSAYYDEYGFFTEKTENFVNGILEYSDVKKFRKRTMDEMLREDEKTIKYILEFFNLLREKVFPFFKGDIVSYLIDEEILSKIFPEVKNSSKEFARRRTKN